MKLVDADTVANALPPEVREAQRRAYLMLQNEGYPAECLASGSIAFRCDGGSFYLCIYPDDPGYLQIVFPNFWPITSDDERHRALLAASRANFDIKIAKVYLMDDLNDVSGSAELVLTSPESFPLLLRRATRALWAGARAFQSNMRKSAAAVAPLASGGVSPQP